MKRNNLTLSCEAIRNCDQTAIERYHIPGVVLMENAGRGAAEAIIDYLKESPSQDPPRVLIVAGTGNNGGDGFVVARQLDLHGIESEILICGPREKVGGDARVNLDIIEAMGLPVRFFCDESDEAWNAIIETTAGQCVLIVDAMLGTGLTGPPREPFSTTIHAINRLDKPVIALDIPSGLNGDTGEAYDPTIRADLTLTFAAMKTGFGLGDAHQYVGDIFIQPIGIRTDYLVK